MMFCVQTGNLAVDLIANILIFAAGTAILVKGSDLFIDSAAGMARLWGVSELVIGLTLVSIGTSLPELASSVYAGIEGQGDFIIGNIVGSNVTNISLILAAGIIGMGKMPFEREVLTRDGIFMLFVYLVRFKSLFVDRQFYCKLCTFTNFAFTCDGSSVQVYQILCQR